MEATEPVRCAYCGVLYPLSGESGFFMHVLNEHPRSEMAANIQIELALNPSVVTEPA